MTDRDRQSLLDIINSATLVATYLDGKTQSDFNALKLLAKQRPEYRQQLATRSRLFPGRKSSG